MNLKNAGILVASGVILLGCVTLAANKEIQLDLKNAVQHISSVNIETNNGKATMKSTNEGKIWIDTNNFVISEEDNANTLSGTVSNSSILGGHKNVIRNATYGVIVTGSENVIVGGNYSVVAGGEGNSITGSYSVVAGGEGNSITGSYSVVAGGEGNSINGDYSTVVGNNSSVSGSNSVAMGSNSKINANNSFLWTDGEDETINLSVDDVFAILSKSGMVVNTNLAHPLAQLTIGGSLTVAGSGNVVCEGGKGVGTLKLVQKSGNQKCLCSCNGNGWDSVLGDGQCVAKCAGVGSNLTPRCPQDGTGLEIIEEDGIEYYSGSCVNGDVVSGSYYVNETGIVWACQERDGTTVSECLYTLSCSGSIPPNATANNNLLPKLPKQNDNTWTYHHSEDKGEVCSFSCDAGHYWENGQCKPICDLERYNCNKGTYHTGYDSYSQAGYYMCDDVMCEVQCVGGRNWNGENCVFTNDACDQDLYSCNVGKVDNKMDMQSYHRRDCTNSDGSVYLAQNCRWNKKVHTGYLCEHVVNTVDNTSLSFTSKIYFTLSGISSPYLPQDLVINLPRKDDNGRFVITVNGAQVGGDANVEGQFNLSSGTNQTETKTLYNGHLIKLENATLSPSTMYTETDYYTVSIDSKCKSENYVCYGSTGTNTKINDYNTTPTVNTKYHYSETMSEACSFSCANGYHYESAGGVCCQGNPSDYGKWEKYAIYTGGECRLPDHWEWRFYEDKNHTKEIDKITFNVGNGLFEDPIYIDGWFFNEKIKTFSYGGMSVNGWLRNQWFDLRGTEGNIQKFKKNLSGLGTHTLTIDLKSFQKDGFPVTDGFLNFDADAHRRTVEGVRVDISFDKDQPKIDTVKAQNFKGGTKDLYLYTFARFTDSVNSIIYGNMKRKYFAGIRLLPVYDENSLVQKYIAIKTDGSFNYTSRIGQQGFLKTFASVATWYPKSESPMKPMVYAKSVPVYSKDCAVQTVTVSDGYTLTDSHCGTMYIPTRSYKTKSKIFNGDSGYGSISFDGPFSVMSDNVEHDPNCGKAVVDCSATFLCNDGNLSVSDESCWVGGYLRNGIRMAFSRN